MMFCKDESLPMLLNTTICSNTVLKVSHLSFLIRKILHMLCLVSPSTFGVVNGNIETVGEGLCI